MPQIALLGLFLVLYHLAPPIQAQIQRPIGTNLTSVNYYSTELVYPDVFKQARSFRSIDLATTNYTNLEAQIPTDAKGYPLEIPYTDGTITSPQGFRTILVWNRNLGIDHYPGGNYRLKVAGTGRVQVRWLANGVFQTPVDTLIYIDTTIDAGLIIDIMESNPADPIHDIQLLYPEFAAMATVPYFHPKFLDYLSDFQVIRYMDWLHTNNSTVRTWSDRPKDQWHTRAQDKGMAWEEIARLSNATQTNPWINIPHLADSNYMVQVATLLRDSLDPNLTIYLELSNEFWNGSFDQYDSLRAQGMAAGYTGSGPIPQQKMAVRRMSMLFYIFEQVLGGTTRLVRVLPAQAASPWVGTQLLQYMADPTYNVHGVQADVLAIAPYFGNGVGNYLGQSGQIQSSTVPHILQHTDSLLTHVTATWMQNYKTLATQAGMPLVAYESGQHLTAGNYNTNATLVNKLVEANRDPMMGILYCQYYDYWYDSTQADLLCVFSSHAYPGRYGSWGIKETMNDTANYKYQALQNCVVSQNNPILTHSPILPSWEIWVYPNPASSGQTLHGQVPPNIALEQAQLIDLSGRLIHQWTSIDRYATTFSLPLPNLPKGSYFLVLNGAQGRASRLLCIQ